VELELILKSLISKFGVAEVIAAFGPVVRSTRVN
jgi:hypothetical protein